MLYFRFANAIAGSRWYWSKVQIRTPSASIGVGSATISFQDLKVFAAEILYFSTNFERVKSRGSATATNWHRSGRSRASSQ